VKVTLMNTGAPRVAPDRDEHGEAALRSRREFCRDACQALTIGGLGTLLHACGGSPTSPSTGQPLPLITGTLASGVVSLTIAADSPLAAVGGSALVRGGSANYLVARTSQDGFTALSAICTHEQCTITGFDSQTFVCPCHGSQFTQSGAVTRGPASTALRRFTTEFADNVLRITA
jgi:cytochrome b6-f complex iron-sulfur subunit